jgi:hypothetical protein
MIGGGRVPSAWVLVLGMHRSGTSATAGLLHDLGLVRPADPMTERDDNSEHHESVSLTDANDSILGLLAGTWDAPPALSPGWEQGSDLAAIRPLAARVAAAAFPGPEVALWKDPRNSLLLPFWAQMLEPIVGVVLPWREPLAVARSLKTRDGIPIGRGLELWYRYNTSALYNSRSYETLVVNYDELVQDPMEAATAAAAWLGKVIPGYGRDTARVAHAAGTVSPLLRHEHSDGHVLPKVCEELRSRLCELRGGIDLVASAADPGRPPPG